MSDNGNCEFAAKVYTPGRTNPATPFDEPGYDINTLTNQKGLVYYWDGGGQIITSGTWNLPNVSASNGRLIIVSNPFTFDAMDIITLTLDTNGQGAIIWRGSHVDKISSLVLQPGQCVWIRSNGTYWVVEGYDQP